MIFQIIKPVYAQTPIGNLGTVQGVGLFQRGDSNTILGTAAPFISGLVGALTIIGGLGFLLYFILGAIKWTTSGGDKGKTQEAQTQLTQGAIGLIVVAVSYFIVGVVGGVVGINILNPLSVLFPSFTP